MVNMSEEQQSRFSDHIKVAGDYYWEQGKQEQMLLDVRGTIFLRINQRWPSIKSAEHEKVITLVAELSGLETSLIEQLLFSQNKLNQSQFTQCMKGLQQLRKIL
jgi:hypothetical protein